MGALSFTGRTVNDAEVFDSQGAVVARLAHLLATSDDYDVHIGASGTYVFSPADQGSLATPPRYPVRFRERPELRVDSTRLIDTGSIDAEHTWVTGLEFGARYRNLYVQAEHFWFGIERRTPTALSDPRFRGYYIQGTWVLTGESRRYSMASGSFQNPRPRAPVSSSGGYGAWELAVRFSDTDLNYHEGLPGFAPPADGVRGGEQKVFTIGLNWYPTTNLKLMLDYLHIDVDRLNPAGPGNLTPFGAAPATPPIGAQIGQDLNAVALRSQFAF
jgi:phosphate-selective porin OprO/OprP